MVVRTGYTRGPRRQPGSNPSWGLVGSSAVVSLLDDKSDKRRTASSVVLRADSLLLGEACTQYRWVLTSCWLLDRGDHPNSVGELNLSAICWSDVRAALPLQQAWQVDRVFPTAA